MNKIWLVARHEFRRYVTRRAFLFAVLGLPLLLAAVIFVVALIAGGDATVGVVDHSGVLLQPELYSAQLEDGAPFFVAFADEEAARLALEQGEIRYYFTVPAAYPLDNEIVIYQLEEGDINLYDEIAAYLRASLVEATSVEPATVNLLVAGGDLPVRFVSLREGGVEDPFSAFIFPFFVGFLLVMSIFTSAGYMLQSVVDEKENRTMEILVTSLRPEQLMTGKVLGLVALGLVQTAIWLLVLLALFLYARSRWEFLDALTLPPTLLFIAIAWFIPFYIMMASLMAAIGVSVTAVSEGQQAASVITLLTMVPFWLLAILLEAPLGPISVALSLIPFTAPLTMLVRWPLAEIPLWQMVASWLLLTTAALLSLWLVGRLLRVGMLRYGQRLSLREVRGALRGGE
ncbi:MAG: ABC transporter permease [Candidatus Promineifilaceae bacterium]|nr:ABC transporter permease [Candidatus Promineifilaceae bacterium]